MEASSDVDAQHMRPPHPRSESAPARAIGGETQVPVEAPPADATPADSSAGALPQMWMQAFAHCLQSVGDVEFAISGTVPEVNFIAPTISVQTVGRLAIPLAPDQVMQLRVISEPAFGFVDPLRRAREVCAPLVDIRGHRRSKTIGRWEDAMTQIAEDGLVRMCANGDSPTFLMRFEGLLIVDPVRFHTLNLTYGVAHAHAAPRTPVCDARVRVAYSLRV